MPKIGELECAAIIAASKPPLAHNLLKTIAYRKKYPDFCEKRVRLYVRNYIIPDLPQNTTTR
jgi:hypothetical protein